MAYGRRKGQNGRQRIVSGTLLAAIGALFVVGALCGAANVRGSAGSSARAAGPSSTEDAEAADVKRILSAAAESAKRINHAGPDMLSKVNNPAVASGMAAPSFDAATATTAKSPDTQDPAMAKWHSFLQAQEEYNRMAYAHAQAQAHAEAQAFYGQAAAAAAAAAAAGAHAPAPNAQPAADSSTPDAASFVETASQAQAQAQAGWGFGRGFQPQLYGYWQQKQGSWNFGADKRIECEACTYVTYMLIDRLGDQFNRQIIKDEAENTCSRVQWVFKSACDYILGKNLNTVSDLVMKLIEPHDICKHLDMCQPDMMDLMGYGGMNGFSPSRLGITLPPSVRARMLDMQLHGNSKGSGSGSGAVPSGGTMGDLAAFNRPGIYGSQSLPFGPLPLGLAPNPLASLYGLGPGTFYSSGSGSGSGSGSE